ncbi:S41 family peptidase [Candidatus Saccharibacteria bacterium]|nr:S41 family peptidase [Candidatus Saccharibacteria bacterium]
MQDRQQGRLSKQFGWRKRSFVPAMLLVAVVAFSVGVKSDEIAVSTAQLFGNDASVQDLETGSLQSTYDELQANYAGEMDATTLEEGAVRGMVEAVGDEYTQYMSASEAEEFNNELSGSIGGGIGAEIGQRNDNPTIIRVLDGFPAQAAGLQAGDTIVSVNDKAVLNGSVNDVVEQIRGQVGTSVEVGVRRDGSDELIEKAIVREEISTPSVESKIENNIGILTISRFDEETGNLARKAANEFRENDVQGVVLDLRGNGGGHVTAAQAVAGIWLDNETVLTERRGDKIIDTITSTGSPILQNTPTTILVNETSASASEIVAGALKEYNKATLVGQKTFGKGSVQQLIPLRDGGQLKVTIAKWYTPKGKNITKDGIEPDKRVELSAEDVNANRDPQLDAALESLRD